MPDFLTAPGCGGALTIPERLFIKQMAEQAVQRFGAKGLAVNIGVDYGGTLWCIRAGAPECELYGIDINPDSERGDWTLIHGDSRRVHAVFQDGSIGLLLVDGDHDYYGVRADITNWLPKVAPGGLVLFHDYGNGEKYPWTAGVKRAVDEMIGEGWQEAGIADSIKAFVKVAE